MTEVAPEFSFMPPNYSPKKKEVPKEKIK